MMNDDEIDEAQAARRNRRLEVIAKFVDENADLFLPDDVDFGGENPTKGPLMVTGWALVVRVLDVGDDGPHGEFDGTFSQLPDTQLRGLLMTAERAV